MIELLEYLLLGLIQGFTEPIPVSSSGHLMIFNSLLNTNIDIELLAILTNFGSLIAILVLYRKRLLDLFINFFSHIKTKDKKTKNDFNYGLYLIIATIPVGVMGIIATKSDMFKVLDENIKFVGITLLITALFLFLIKNKKGSKSDNEVTLKDALLIGLFQILALIPGISRSGATIVAGMFRNLKREVAFDFAFLLYIPVSLGTSILGLKDLFSYSLQTSQVVLYLGATVIATVVTYFATKWFRDIVKHGKLIYFVYYCLLAGLLVILFL